MIFGQDVAQLKIAMLLTPKKLINIVNNRSLIRIVSSYLRQMRAPIADSVEKQRNYKEPVSP